MPVCPVTLLLDRPASRAALSSAGIPSICILVNETLYRGLEQDLKIQPQGQMLYVMQIVSKALLDLLKRVGGSPPSIYLGPAGDTGLDPQPSHIT